MRKELKRPRRGSHVLIRMIALLVRYCKKKIISEKEVAISDQNTKIASLEANQLTLQSEILEKESKLSLTLDEKRTFG